jgi:predicted Holliday junction resolvase-like endonuclease
MIESLIILALIFAVFILLLVVRNLKSKIRDLLSSKQSLSTKYGKMTEQFMPFLNIYPYDEQNFRFIGSPIDGIQFENDKVIFIEFKTSNSALTAKQRNIKDLIKNKKVEFEEIRMDQVV